MNANEFRLIEDLVKAINRLAAAYERHTVGLLQSNLKDKSNEKDAM